MTLIARFCCCLDLRTGALFSGFYVLILSSIFLTKHAVWLRLLLVGEIHDNLEPFIDTLLRDRNDSSWNPTALNLTAELHRRNVASHILHLLWSSGGVLTSLILLVAIFNKLPLLFLPWLSWSSVNGVILLVNTVVDVLIWSYFHLYSSMNLFTVYGYANLPFMIYLLFVTASYYQTLETIYEDNQMRCCTWCPCKRLWQKVPSDPSSPTIHAQRYFLQRWYHSTNEEPPGSNRNGLGTSLMGNGAEHSVADEEHVEITGECKRSSLDISCSTSPPKRSKKKQQKQEATSNGSKKKCKPPKIKVSQPSTEDDW